MPKRAKDNPQLDPQFRRECDNKGCTGDAQDDDEPGRWLCRKCRSRIENGPPERPKRSEDELIDPLVGSHRGNYNHDMRERPKPAINEDDYEERVLRKDRGPHQRFGTFRGVPKDLGQIPDMRPNEDPDEPPPYNPTVDACREATGQPKIIQKPWIDVLLGTGRVGWCAEMESRPAHAEDCPVCMGRELDEKLSTCCLGCTSASIAIETKLGIDKADERRRKQHYPFLSQAAIEKGETIKKGARATVDKIDKAPLRLRRNVSSEFLSDGDVERVFGRKFPKSESPIPILRGIADEVRRRFLELDDRGMRTAINDDFASDFTEKTHELGKLENLTQRSPHAGPRSKAEWELENPQKEIKIGWKPTAPKAEATAPEEPSDNESEAPDDRKANPIGSNPDPWPLARRPHKGRRSATA